MQVTAVSEVKRPLPATCTVRNRFGNEMVTRFITVTVYVTDGLPQRAQVPV